MRPSVERSELPSLSIITPSFNQAQYIDQTIRSVLDQGYAPLEYLVMDGGSIDGTVEILKSYGDRLAYVSERDGGQAAAFNTGLSRTSGEIVGWINSDDFYAEGAFEAVSRHFAENPDCEWLIGRCPIVDRDGKVYKEWVTRYKEFWLKRYSYRRLLIENFISQPAVFFRRRLLERIGGPLDVNYHCAMDYHLFVRMARASKPAVLDRVLAYFRSSGDNKTSLAYARSFAEELDAAKRVADGRHPVLMFLHEVNRIKLTTVYKVLQRLAT